jgi:hypothetical protein
MNRFALLSMIAAAAVSSSAFATVNTAAFYQLGESDPGATYLGAANATTVDSSGNGNTMTLNGTGATYSAGGPATGSTLSVDFGTAGANYSTTTAVIAATDNFGIEGWFKPTAVTSSSVESLTFDGNSGDTTMGCCGSGYGLYIFQGNYMVLFGNKAFLDTGVAATAGAWTYFAFVRDNGVNEVYINSTTAMTPNNISTGDGSNVAPIVPTTASGFENTSIGSGFANGDPFNGAVDDVRYFTFDPGAFVTSDLLVPEPATMSIMGMGVLGLLARRRK